MIDWEGILSRDGPAAWQAAWRVLGNRADADECFQEACLAALEYSNGHTVTHWRALLSRMATARAVDRLRQRARRRNHEFPYPQDHLACSNPLPPQRVEDAELAANLRSALAQIPPDHAQVFCLFHMSGWSYPEIAQSLAISTDLVGVWLQRARGRLRALLTTVNHKDEVSS